MSDRKELISVTDHYEIWFYPDLKIVHSRFLKFTRGLEFREALSKGIEVFTKNNCLKWLSDDRNIGLVSQEDAAWSREVWYGNLAKAGWKYWALVKPETKIGTITFKNSTKKINDPNMAMKIFSNPEDALNWLKSVN